MPIIKFPNTAAGKAQAEALSDPKYIAYGPRITVFTGADVPPAGAVVDPSSIVLTTRQLMQGADAIARARLQAIEGYIRGIVGVTPKTLRTKFRRPAHTRRSSIGSGTTRPFGAPIKRSTPCALLSAGTML